MPKKNNTSSTDIIKILWDENFFLKPRGLSEISEEIKTKGFNFSLSNLNMTLVRMVQVGGILSRLKKMGQWKYVQKYPAASATGKREEIFSKYDFHPRIKEVSLKQFEDGNFKEAIQNALVEVIDQVKVRLGNPKNKNGHDLDGDDLMNKVFACDGQTPLISFNNLRTGLDKAEQRGIMYLFKGIVGIRDRKAHVNFLQNDPTRAIEYLSLASLLMRLLDEFGPTQKP